MKSYTERLADFALETRFEDLPEAAIHESKRILLDSVGCALAGLSTGKGRISADFALRLGGPKEATILGTGRKVSAAAAAFANGEMINAMDFDTVTPPGHVSPYVIPASLAMTELKRSSGKDLILALALAHEISARVGAALASLRYVSTDNGKSKIVWREDRFGFGGNIFGGTAAAGRILGLDQAGMVSALGIAGHICPVPAHVKYLSTLPVFWTKYLSSGWLSQAEVSAVLLAQMGYAGDQTVLDGDRSFWQMYGSSTWAPEKMFNELGNKWLFLMTNYKCFPNCGAQASGLDCFKEIIQTNNLQPQDIQEIHVFGDPITIKFPIWRDNRQIVTHVDTQWNIPYDYAMVAYRVPPGPDWQDKRNMENQEILAFTKKVTLASHPSFDSDGAVQEVAGAGGHLMSHRITRVEVLTNGKKITGERGYWKGSYMPEEARMSDQDLVDKFRVNTSRVLSQAKMDRASKAMLELDKMKDASELMKHLVPKKA